MSLLLLSLNQMFKGFHDSMGIIAGATHQPLNIQMVVWIKHTSSAVLSSVGRGAIVAQATRSSTSVVGTVGAFNQLPFL